jgi:hypothetical protein
MATITYHPSDSALVERIQADLAAQPPAERDQTAVFVLSPQATADPDVQRALVEAVSRRRRVIPVLAQPVPLPALIEHLEPLDFSQQYEFERLAARLSAAPDVMQMKVRTPDVIAANRRMALIVLVFVLIMFVAALYGVGVLGIQAPAREYAAVETEIIQTRDAYIEAALPRSTEDALGFQATVDAAAPTLRPLLAATATAVAGS